MSRQEVEAVVVGGGQAGLAMSEHLSDCGATHLVLERSRIAERWRSERWDSLVANGPAWHDRFPGLDFVDLAPDAFASKEQIAEYFEAYAEKIAARTKEYEERFLSPFAAAERGYIDDVIAPRQTRQRIARALAMLRGKRLEMPARKHDNLPL